jgi:pyruvate formate lyase activating enzyme
MDAGAHKTYTGIDNRVIVENVKRIDNSDIPIIVRIPIIPEHTDGAKNLMESARFCSTIRNLERVDLLPYNPMSESKYARLHRKYPLQGLKPPGNEEMVRIGWLFESAGLKIQIGG